MILHARGEGRPFPRHFWGGLCSFPGIRASEERADVPSRALRAETRCPLLHGAQPAGRSCRGRCGLQVRPLPGAGRALEGAAAAAIPARAGGAAPGIAAGAGNRCGLRLPSSGCSPAGTCGQREELPTEPGSRACAPGWQRALGHRGMRGFRAGGGVGCGGMLEDENQGVAASRDLGKGQARWRERGRGRKCIAEYWNDNIQLALKASQRNRGCGFQAGAVRTFYEQISNLQNHIPIDFWQQEEQIKFPHRWYLSSGDIKVQTKWIA